MCKKEYKFSRGSNVRDVPYSRLVDASPISQLPQKLDSDSILNTERSKSILNVPEIEAAPKSSVSDSKLAVDYFSVQESENLQQASSPQSWKIITTEPSPISTQFKGTESVNVSDSHHSLSAKSDSDERLKQEVSYIEFLYLFLIFLLYSFRINLKNNIRGVIV